MCSRVLNWLRQLPAGYGGEPELRPMDEPLLQMQLRLGQANILCHGPNCSHVFMFKDVRLEDASSTITYPRTIFRSKIVRAKCRMCTIYPAEVVLIDDVHSGDTPCFLCNTCYVMFTQDETGRPLRPVHAYPFASTRIRAEDGHSEETASNQ
jgi:hypothetical protein